MKEDEKSRTCSRCGGNEKCMHNLVGNLKGRGHLGDLVVDMRIILILMLKKWTVRVWTGFR
jgi:hypothetical protein